MNKEICFVNLQSEKGGAQVFADEFVDELQSRNISTTYIVERRQANEVSDWIESKQSIELRVCRAFWFDGKRRLFKLFEIGMFPVYFFFLVITALFDLRGINYDIIYLNNGGYPGSWKQLAFCLAAKFYGKGRVVQIIHHKFGSSKVFRPGEFIVHRLVAKSCDHVICVSQATMDSSRHKFEMFKDKIMVIENFVPEGLGHSPEIRQLVGTSEVVRFRDAKSSYAFPILLIGRLESNKGQAEAIRALEASGCFGLDLGGCLILVGASGNEKYANEVFKAIDCCSFPVFWFEYLDVDHDDLYSDVSCVLISSTDFEGFGLTAIEAMKRGVPVVATQVGALRSVVTPSRGFPVELGKPASLLAAIQYINESPPELDIIIKNGRSYASEKSRSKVVDEYLSVA